MEASPKQKREEVRRAALQAARIRLSGRYDLTNVTPTSDIYVEAWSIGVGLDVSDKLIIQFTRRFPFTLPHIYLDSSASFGVIAHVNSEGRFCFLEEAAITYDIARIADVVEEAVERCITALRDPTPLMGEDEFRKELFAYLATSSKFVSLLSSFDAIKAVAILRFEEETRGKFRFLIADDAETGEKWIDNSGFAKIGSQGSAMFLPEALSGKPPFPKNNREVLQHLRNVGSEAFLEWKRHVRKSPLFVTSVNSSLGITLVAWEHKPSPFADKKTAPRIPGFRPGKYPVEAEMTSLRGDEPIQFFAGERIDLDRLVRRTDPTVSVRDDLKVVLVGAGAIGSHLIELFTEAAICKSVTIFDGDALGVENVLRHTASFGSVGFNKALIVAISIQRKCPWMKVEWYDRDVLYKLEEFAEEVSQADHVLLATGSEEVDQFLASSATAIGKAGLKVSQLWLESEAVRGHVVVYRKESSPCPDCWRVRRATQDLHNLQVEPGCNASFANYGGSRLQRFLAIATDFILNSNSPKHLLWEARADNLLQDHIDSHTPDGRGCERC